MKIIKTVGVVGAGTMGAALAQKFAQENFKVILADREQQFVDRGISNIRKMLQEGLEKKVFTEQQVSTTLDSICGTADLNELKSCDLIIEAIFENFEAKTDLFRALSGIVSAETILATNTSSFSVTELAGSVSHPERFIGLHYFYHAAKNRLVEIIPGEKTSASVFDAMEVFCVQSGKDAITCRDVHGFVVNRYFVPWLNEACRLLEENTANTATIDDVCMKAFGIGMGPFALMNATGVPVAYHSQKTLEVFGEAYKVSECLQSQTEKKQNWVIDGDISSDENIRQQISDRMLGIVFLVCSQILDEKVCTAGAINRGARIGLQWKKGPVDLMLKYGEEKVKGLVSSTALLYHTKLPMSIGAGFWKMEYITLRKYNKAAVITISRPEDLNALNEDVVRELDERFSAADSDPAVETIFITGAGKAFVAGADIHYFVRKIKENKIQDIETFTAYGQQVFKKIDESKKKVVAVLNGLALGGGLELALCADLILALPRAQLGFPETGIGIYPGLGGTQRSARRVGKALSKYLIHTGRMLSAADAYEIGLIDRVIFVPEMFELFEGKNELPASEQVQLNLRWKNIQHFFEVNPIGKLLEHQYTTNGIKDEEAEKFFATIRRKAPIALHIADRLIDEAKGCESELLYLKEIFSTSDALLGLTHIGKKVEYEGR